MKNIKAEIEALENRIAVIGPNTEHIGMTGSGKHIAHPTVPWDKATHGYSDRDHIDAAHAHLHKALGMGYHPQTGETFSPKHPVHGGQGFEHLKRAEAHLAVGRGNAKVGQ